MWEKHKRTKKKERKQNTKRILTGSVMRSSSCKLQRRICGSSYCTGKHDCSLSNSRSKLGGYGYSTGQRTQKHDDFHHESLHTEHDQRKHDQLGGRTQSSFSTEQPQPALHMSQEFPCRLQPGQDFPSPTQAATHSHASGTVCPCWHMCKELHSHITLKEEMPNRFSIRAATQPARWRRAQQLV